jgi:hypothetical protein
MSTNREWECGTMYVLKWRKSLHVDNQAQHDGENIDWIDEHEAEAALSSLLKYMRNVKVLKIGERCPEAAIRQLIHAFADQLEELSVYSYEMDYVSSAMNFCFPKLKRSHCDDFDAANGSTFFPKMERLIEFGLKNSSYANACMPNLTELVHANKFSPTISELHGFLLKNSKTLTKLWIENTCDVYGLVLDFNADDVVFEKLEEIEIDDFTFASKCPALKSVTARSQESASIADLHVNNITKLVLNLRDMTDDNRKTFYSAIDRMINLKHLKLLVGDLNDEDVSLLFTGKYHLETVFIGCEGSTSFDHAANDWVTVVKQNNRNLQSLKIQSGKYFFL